ALVLAVVRRPGVAGAVLRNEANAPTPWPPPYFARFARREGEPTSYLPSGSLCRLGPVGRGAAHLTRHRVVKEQMLRLLTGDGLGPGVDDTGSESRTLRLRDEDALVAILMARRRGNESQTGAISESAELIRMSTIFYWPAP